MSYYRILGVSADASDSDITEAYRRLIKKLHPDTNPGDPAAEELFKKHYKEVVLAYNVLSDASKRKAYDEIDGPRAGAPQAGGEGTTSGNRQPRRPSASSPSDHRYAQDRDRTAPGDPPDRGHQQPLTPKPEPERQPSPRRPSTSGPGKTRPGRQRLEPKIDRQRRGRLGTVLMWLLMMVISFGGGVLLARNWSALLGSLVVGVWGGALWLWSVAESAAEKGRRQTAVVVVVLQVILLAGLLPVTGIGLAYGVGWELSPTTEKVLGVVGSVLALAWGWIGLDILKHDYRDSEPGQGRN